MGNSQPPHQKMVRDIAQEWGQDSCMEYVPKPTTDDALIQEFLNKGGKIKVGKTKPLPNELRLSNNAWNNKLTREEKAALDKK